MGSLAFSCSGKIENFPDLADCRFFYHCGVSGVVQRHRCAESMVFSVKEDICVRLEHHGCPDLSTTEMSRSRLLRNTTQTTISTVATATSVFIGSTFSCRTLPPGRYANVDDGCKSFWICDETEYNKLQNCPAGFLFDNTAQACDQPVNVICSNQILQLAVTDPTTTSHTKPVSKNKAALVDGSFQCWGNSGFFADLRTDCR